MMIEAIVLVLIIKTSTMVVPEYLIGPKLYSTLEQCEVDGERALVEIERDDPDALAYWCVPQSAAERLRKMSGIHL
jgi:hypothetical protein